jgi:hypothetical protein
VPGLRGVGDETVRCISRSLRSSVSTAALHRERLRSFMMPLGLC